MSKMRNFKFITTIIKNEYPYAEEKIIEAPSFKKAIKSFQATSKEKKVTIEWTTKKGEGYVKEQKLPLGRKKKIGKQSKVTVSKNPLVKILVRLRMWYADVRGHHGKKWDYEPSKRYMGGQSKKHK